MVFSKFLTEINKSVFKQIIQFNPPIELITEDCKELEDKLVIYIAGLSFLSLKLDLKQKTSLLLDQLPIIHDDATKLMGKNVVIIIVLQEYSFTPFAIPNKEKKDTLNQLDKATKQYKNIILIPGSFAAYDVMRNCKNPNERKRKIIANYNQNLQNPYYKHIYESYGTYQQCYMKAKLRMNSGAFCLQNSSYIMSSQNNKKIKHQKSYPINDERYSNPLSFFYPGLDPQLETKHVPTMDNKSLDINLIICSEHNIPYTNEIVNNPPLIQVIVSNTIPTIKEHLYGFLTIHMDHNLSVYVNDEHPKKYVHDMIAISAFEYDLENKIKIPIDIQHFDIDIAKQAYLNKGNKV